MNDKLKWGARITNNGGSFLLGANINIGTWNVGCYGYICIYLGLWTLVIGRDVF